MWYDFYFQKSGAENPEIINVNLFDVFHCNGVKSRNV